MGVAEVAAEAAEEDEDADAAAVLRFLVDADDADDDDAEACAAAACTSWRSITTTAVAYVCVRSAVSASSAAGTNVACGSAVAASSRCRLMSCSVRMKPASWHGDARSMCDTCAQRSARMRAACSGASSSDRDGAWPSSHARSVPQNDLNMIEKVSAAIDCSLCSTSSGLSRSECAI